MAEEPKVPAYVIEPREHASLRQTVLSWAVSTSKTGETQAAVLARAEAYLAFVLDPLRAELVQAQVERNAALLH